MVVLRVREAQEKLLRLAESADVCNDAKLGKRGGRKAPLSQVRQIFLFRLKTFWDHPRMTSMLRERGAAEMAHYKMKQGRLQEFYTYC